MSTPKKPTTPPTPPTTATATAVTPTRRNLIRELIDAVLVAAAFFIATLLAELICDGADITEQSVGRDSIVALIAAGLGLLGWEIYAHRPVRPAVIAPGRPPGVYTREPPL